MIYIVIIKDISIDCNKKIKPPGAVLDCRQNGVVTITLSPLYQIVHEVPVKRL